MFPRLLPVAFALVGAFRRFPLVVVAALTATVTAVIANHSDGDAHDFYQRLIMTMLFAFPAFVAATFFGELRPRLLWAANLAGLLAVAGVWRLLPHGENYNDQIVPYRYLMLLISAVSISSLVPGLVTKPEGNWWRVNVGMLNALVLAAILSGIVLMGLEIAVFSIQKLFTLQLEKLPEDIFAFCSLFFGPLAVIALFPPFREELNPAQSGFAFWGNLCKWALLPLGFLFIGILAVYAGFILVQWKLPNGMVATPVLSLGAYGTAAMLLLQPWRESRAWARIFAGIYPPAFLLASILLFISLDKRIGAYGVTFGRYSALAAGIWLFFSAGFFLLRFRQAVVVVPALLALFSLTAALGPLSAGSTTLRSQTARLKQFLALSREEQQKNVQQIRSALECLGGNFGPSAVEKITGPLPVDDQRYDVGNYIANVALKKLGLHEADHNLRQSFSWNRTQALPISGYRFLYASISLNEGYGSLDLASTSPGEPMQLKVQDGELAVFAAGRKLTVVNLDFLKPGSNDAGMPPMIPLQIEGREFLVIITQAQWSEPPDDFRKKFESVTCNVLEK
jgi:hypothetical protein